MNEEEKINENENIKEEPNQILPADLEKNKNEKVIEKNRSWQKEIEQKTQLERKKIKEAREIDEEVRKDAEAVRKRIEKVRRSTIEGDYSDENTRYYDREPSKPPRWSK